jgi:hypothetical protein
MRHGYSTLAAVLLHTIFVLVVMIPSLIAGANDFGALPLLSSVTVWSHVVLGTAAWVMGIIIVVAWLRRGPSKMTCVFWKKWMSPVFIIWTISIINGVIVHILGL